LPPAAGGTGRINLQAEVDCSRYGKDDLTLPQKFDPLHYPYPSRRSLIYAQNGMVATSQPLAAQAGLEALKKGGNAIDAAVAAAVCLTVTEPTSNGIGSDAFALVWTGGRLHGLNASGPSPALLTASVVREKGYQEMPGLGWLPVTVPGAPAAWKELSKKWGKLSLKETFLPAIEYARGGFPVSPVTAQLWGRAVNKYREGRGEEFKYWFDTFAPGGKAPGPGQFVRLPDHASTLESIAETDGESFYHGELAEKIDSFSRRYNGFLRGDDLNNYHPFLVDPISTDYRDFRIYELPPNGQGLIVIMALNVLKQLQLDDRYDHNALHRQIEAIKLAFADGFESITDPARMTTPLEELLSENYARQKSSLIGMSAASYGRKQNSGGGTVYLAAADGEGNMVSYIQSNYEGFGSGLVVPGTGIALQNRGKEFSLDPGHCNYLEPGKRTYHTIIPGFLFNKDKPLGPFGLMGGYMQPQGHVQVILNMANYGLNPQAALDAPRWQWVSDNLVAVENSLPVHLARSLADRGHVINYSHELSGFGRGQIIWRDPETCVLCGATEPRADGTVAAW